MFQFSGYRFTCPIYSGMDNNRLRLLGFPIRKSPGQSVFAATRGLSQLATSFIALHRQGIHQLPLVHLFRFKRIAVWYLIFRMSDACVTHWTLNCQRTKSYKILYTSKMVGPGGLEPPTPALSTRCSNQLSYEPH